MKLIGMTDGFKVIASIDRHDYVAIGNIMHDGGQPGTSQYGGYNRCRGKSIYFEIPQTYGELYTDYQNNCGKNAKRCYGVWNIDEVEVLDHVHTEHLHNFDYEVSQAIWGTRGIDGDQPLKYVHLIDCSTTHLRSILDTQNITKITDKIINHILDNRA